MTKTAKHSGKPRNIPSLHQRLYGRSSKVFTPLETSLLPYGGRLLTYMQTVRFLTDYLNGDTYYKNPQAGPQPQAALRHNLSS